MPQAWQKILAESGITRAEQEENPDQVLAVVQFYQDRKEKEAQQEQVPELPDEDVWAKMRNAGPQHGPPSPSMSRENSREKENGLPKQFANPVSPSRLHVTSI